MKLYQINTKAHALARKDVKNLHKVEHRKIYVDLLKLDKYFDPTGPQRAYSRATTLLIKKYPKDFERLFWNARDAVEYEETYASSSNESKN